jgi:bacillaene synthase trans-acting acyltransferase
VPGCKTVFMFSGQGSQYFRMGQELFEKNGNFRESMQRLDELARRQCGQSVLAAIYSGRKWDNFSHTLLTHPAIFMVEYSLAQTLIRAGVTPDLTLGASLGAFAAATVSGFMAVEDALNAVIQQAKAFEAHCEPGSMLAVLAEPTLFADSFLRDHSEIAAINFSTHFAISARQPDIEAIEASLRQRNITYQRLPVSFAFHSRWIEAAQAPFESFMRSIRITKHHLPFVCCDRATTLAEISSDYFWRVVRHPIRFREAIAHLEHRGPHRYIDVGPAGTLATFLKYLLPSTSGSTMQSILTPFGQDQKNFTAVLEAR